MKFIPIRRSEGKKSAKILTVVGGFAVIIVLVALFWRPLLGAAALATCTPNNAGGFGYGFCFQSPVQVTLSAYQNATRPFASFGAGGQSNSGDISLQIISDIPSTSLPKVKSGTSNIYMQVVQNNQSVYYNVTIYNLTGQNCGNCYPNGAGIKYDIQNYIQYTPTLATQQLQQPSTTTSTTTTQTIIAGTHSPTTTISAQTNSVSVPYNSNPIINFLNSLGLYNLLHQIGIE